jgi:hypothetical protein
MHIQNNSLVKGILVGFLISLLVFAGGIYVWRQVSTVELRIPPNKPTSLNIGDMHLSIIYHPDSKKFDISNGNEQGYGAPANVGYGGSWSWGRYIVTQVNSEFLTLRFSPWRFSTIGDVMDR